MSTQPAVNQSQQAPAGLNQWAPQQLKTEEKRLASEVQLLEREIAARTEERARLHVRYQQKRATADQEQRLAQIARELPAAQGRLAGLKASWRAISQEMGARQKARRQAETTFEQSLHPLLGRRSSLERRIGELGREEANATKRMEAAVAELDRLRAERERLGKELIDLDEDLESRKVEAEASFKAKWPAD